MVHKASTAPTHRGPVILAAYPIVLSILDIEKGACACVDRDGVPSSSVCMNLPVLAIRCYAVTLFMMQSLCVGCTVAKGVSPIDKFTSEHGSWHVSALIDYNFLVGGVYEMVLLTQEGILDSKNQIVSSHLDPRSLQLCTLSTDINSPGSCVGSRRVNKNQVMLRANVAAGKYALVLLYTADEPLRIFTPNHDSIAGHCSRFVLSLHVDYVRANSIQGRRDSACDGEPFPSTLNAPGLLDANGFLTFFERVRIDTSVLDQEVTFQLHQASLFRLVISHPRLQIDIGLFDHAREALHDFTVAHRTHDDPGLIGELHGSDRISKDEGIFVYLMPGNYTLVFTVDEAILPPTGYCTLASVAMRIAPFVYGEKSYSDRRQRCNTAPGAHATSSAASGTAPQHLEAGADFLPELKIPTFHVPAKGPCLCPCVSAHSSARPCAGMVASDMYGAMY